TKVRKQGYAQNRGEHEPYIHCITYPVFDSQNRLLAAISLTGLEQMMGDRDPQTIHGALRRAVLELHEETNQYTM
ncbi:MAG: hypothetical protein LBE84_05715, partial [Planctomycetota bacterium]|nr:hypothetical protein [Planctomycetota bacterium]